MEVLGSLERKLDQPINSKSSKLLEADWFKPESNQCDIFTLPWVDVAVCDLSHPNKTEPTDPDLIRENVPLLLEILRKLVSCLEIYVACGILLGAGYCLDCFIQKRLV